MNLNTHSVSLKNIISSYAIVKSADTDSIYADFQ